MAGTIEFVRSAMRCCGCAACSAICPASAIEMVEDACGFVVPEVHQGRCVRCGKCLACCPMAKFMDGGDARGEEGGDER